MLSMVLMVLLSDDIVILVDAMELSVLLRVVLEHSERKKEVKSRD